MLCVYGSPLYQWDKNRQLQINSVDIDSKFEVHCAHSDDSNALVVEPKIEGDTLLTNIPNILLQRSGYLRVYVVTEGDTIYDQTFYVMARQKPDDYVYTETEVFSYKALEERITELEKGGTSEEQIAEAVGKYLAENPIEENDPTVSDWAKQREKPTYTADEVGALSQDELQSGVNLALQQAKESGEFNGKDGKDGKDGINGNDYVLTESDKQDIADMIPIPEVGGGEEWELIADDTLQEDVIDIEYTNLNHKNIYIHIDGMVKDISYEGYQYKEIPIQTSINNEQCMQLTGNMVFVNKEDKACIHIDKVANTCKVLAYRINGTSNRSDVLVNRTSPDCSSGINRIIIQPSITGTFEGKYQQLGRFVAGTNIKIYGIKN